MFESTVRTPHYWRMQGFGLGSKPSRLSEESPEATLDQDGVWWQNKSLNAQSDPENAAGERGHHCFDTKFPICSSPANI